MSRPKRLGGANATPIVSGSLSWPISNRGSATPASSREADVVTGVEDAGGADESSRFAAVRVRPAHRDFERSAPYPEQWLLIEWPHEEAEPIKYWLATSALYSHAIKHARTNPCVDFLATCKARYRSTVDVSTA